MSKYNLLDELKQGLQEAEEHEQSKAACSYKENQATREQPNVSRAVFSTYLHVFSRNIRKIGTSFKQIK